MASRKEQAATRSKGEKKRKVDGSVTEGVAPSVDAAANAALAGQAALAGTQAAGKAISIATSHAKMPLIAGGSMVAGLAGGLAVLKRSRNGHHRKRRQLDLDGLVETARRVGAMGEEVGRIASVVEQATGSRKTGK